MTLAEADEFKILSKTTEVAEAPVENIWERELSRRERESWGAILSSHMQWRRCQKKIQKSVQKNMAEAEADALNILSKMTEEVEDPMEMDMGEGYLKTRKREHWEGYSVIPYAVAEVEK